MNSTTRRCRSAPGRTAARNAGRYPAMSTARLPEPGRYRAVPVYECGASPSAMVLCFRRAGARGQKSLRASLNSVPRRDVVGSGRPGSSSMSSECDNLRRQSPSAGLTPMVRGPSRSGATERGSEAEERRSEAEERRSEDRDLWGPEPRAAGGGAIEHSGVKNETKGGLEPCDAGGGAMDTEGRQ